MGRGSTQVLIREIVKCLSINPKTITELVDEIKLDRSSIVRYLGILKESGLLNEEQKGTSKVYTLIPSFRQDTYFGLPLDKKTEQEVHSLFHLIKKFWSMNSKQQLKKTHAQKIAYKVITSCALNIPHGWYIYGGIGVASFDESTDYNYFGFPKEKEVEMCVKDVTIEYAKNEFAWQSKKQQYDEVGKELYVVKEEILSILYSGDFDKHPKNSIYVIVKKLRRLVELAPRDNRSDYMEILDSYQDLMLDLSNKVDEKILIDNKREIIISFEAIWKYIALFNFKNDLKEFYSESILEAHFKLDILQQENDIIELGTELQEYVPEDVITDPLKKKVHEALSNIKLLNSDEQKTQREYLEKMEKELGHEKFQEFLLEQAGLK
jgi:DNA-binding transcriptional ArsR family regulator